MKSLIKGRILWCANQMVEILPRDYEDIHKAILELASEILIQEKLTSLKLVATRSLIKFSRKIKPEQVQEVLGSEIEGIIDIMAGLMDSASLDTLHLPIEAFTSFSKLNEGIVAQMAPKITPKLLKFFKSFHHETMIT